MDHTTLIAHGLSSCCHAGLLLWVWCSHGADIYKELQESEAHIIDVSDEEVPATQTEANKDVAFTEAKPVPTFHVSVPDRQAVQVAALPIAKLPDLHENALFEQALLEPLAQRQQAATNDKLPNSPLPLKLPTTQFDIGTSFKLPDQAHGEDAQTSRASAAQDFVFVINIIISNHYRKQWRKRYGKHFTNRDLQLLIQTKNSIVSKSELIRGSGLKEFDDLLLAYLHHERISGPPIDDGQYPIVLRLH